MVALPRARIRLRSPNSKCASRPTIEIAVYRLRMNKITLGEAVQPCTKCNSTMRRSRVTHSFDQGDVTEVIVECTMCPNVYYEGS